MITETNHGSILEQAYVICWSFRRHSYSFSLKFIFLLFWLLC